MTNTQRFQTNIFTPPIKLLLITLCFLTTTLNMHNAQNSQPQLYFDFNSQMIPHPQKAHRGGQDAYYNSSKMLVVADGVGGWNNRGIDPSKYSRHLCEMSKNISMSQNANQYLNEPIKIIQKAQSTNKNVGSATMEVLTLSTDNKLKYCYIGDSGFMVIRSYEDSAKQRDSGKLYLSIYQYVQQQHGFNFPYQLALPEYGGDDPDNAICGEIVVKVNDIIVVGSDGLYDNVAFREVRQMVKKSEQEGTLLTKLSKILAELAIKRGQDPKFNSPFAQRAKQHNLAYIGGKLDDTTVIVAKIKSRSANSQKNPQLL